MRCPPSCHVRRSHIRPFGTPLRKLRNLTAHMKGVSGKKKSLDLTLAFSPSEDPEIIAAKALVSRYSREIWNACLTLCFRDPSGLALGFLAEGVAIYLARHAAPPMKVSGPISALHFALVNCGWKFFKPFIFLNRVGREIHLLSYCPRRTAKLFAKDYQRAIQDRAVSKLSGEANSGESIHFR